MTLSFWRYLHLTLAIISSLFLVVAAITGTILAVDAVQQKIPSYKVADFNKITVAQTLPVLRKTYPEITELSIDHNQFVTLQAMDDKGEDVNAYINPITGKVMGIPPKKNAFIQWVTSLHRSLFLHETGRFIVGINAFLLVLISISGFVLILKRQRGIRHFFSKIIKEYFAQYYHVFLGRLLLIPILVIAISGTYLSIERFKIFENKAIDSEAKSVDFNGKKTSLDLKNTLLSQVHKIEFPFSDDQEDYYTFELNDRKIEVNQYTNQIITEQRFPFSKLAAELSLDLHTGSIHPLWAIVLGLASLNILFFIYSGFAMTFKRRASRLKNKYTPGESKFILLVGSENGSTLRFANAIYNQLIAQGHKAHISELNKYTTYPKAEQLLVFTSTYGLGDPPSNAQKFSSLMLKTVQERNINFSVIGFGSKAYPDFCGFATEVDTLLEQQSWANRLLDIQTINDKSIDDFMQWVTLWAIKTEIQLSTTPSLYRYVPKDLENLLVLHKTTVSDNDQTFLLTLRTNWRTQFNSGDLLAIYPTNDDRERLYSIGKINGNIQLSVKLHTFGLGTNYLYNLNSGTTIKARIVKNDAFHLPQKATGVALISNGTGIAPFLGMLEQNKKKIPIQLYSGFQKETQTTLQYKEFAAKMIAKKHLDYFHITYSRAENHQYVMDLIRKDTAYFADLLAQKGIIMICGAIAMQIDVEALLDTICLTHHQKPLSFYKANGQIKTDCY